MIDIKINSGEILSANADRLYQNQRTPNPQSVSNEDKNFLQMLQEKEEVTLSTPANDTVLSLPEMATLHVLFGSEKPDDSSFYGKSNASQIYKGHLLDVAG